MIPGGGRFDIPEGEDKEEWIQFFEEAARATREGRGHRRAAATDVQPTASTVPRCCPTAPTAKAPSTASPVDGIRSTASPTPMRGSPIAMIGPKRGTDMSVGVLIEFDMKIKRGEEELDDTQLIDGVTDFDELMTPAFKPFLSRIDGVGGAVDMTFSYVPLCCGGNNRSGHNTCL